MTEPFDSALCVGATLSDLSDEHITWFLTTARKARGLSLPNDTPPQAALEHLRLSRQGRLTNAAILLLGKEPQRFFKSCGLECAQLTAPDPASPSKVFQGKVFKLMSEGDFFALSKISTLLPPPATRLPGATSDYEIPLEAVHEAIANAVTHRDYTDSRSIKVTVFSDRLEVWNPGALPPSLTLDQLRQPHSPAPANPLLAQSLRLIQPSERKSVGTTGMIELCRKARLPEPQFKLVDNGFLAILPRLSQRLPEPVGEETGEQASPVFTPHILELLSILDQAGPLGNAQILERMGLKGRSNLRERVINPALEAGLIEPTIPDTPNSRLQQYRITAKGKAVLAS
jgi:predicted HTH transcriptional regulator